jgi:hypothetical protein
MQANFPPWQTVYQQFRAWRDGGVGERVNKVLNEQGPKRKNEKPRPRSLSPIRREPGRRLKGQRGYNTGKKIKGHKRHIAVDILSTIGPRCEGFTFLRAHPATSSYPSPTRPQASSTEETTPIA